MDVDAIVGGNLYDVTTTALILAGHDGLGEAPLHRLTERGAQQNGDTDVGYRLDPRIFSLAFEYAGNAGDRYDERQRLRRLFTPQAELTLRFTLPNFEVRNIDCKRLEAPLPVESRGALGQRLTYRFRAAEAPFYATTEQTATWSLNVSDDLVLPYELPYFLGGSIINDAQDIAYVGDIDTHPVIQLTGPMVNPLIENQETGDKLHLIYTIAAGQAVTIDTRYGSKSVTLTGGTRLVLTDDSNLGTFAIVAAIDGTASRTNTIFASATGAVAGQTNIQIAWYNRYGGL